ncbi:MAG: hypothetical protein ACD_7C00419G0001 [uncultured bacterium]|nr:MAG: hypothetical protein ACD_7C00419G0001 [uncultured bacterium]HBR79326.1 hypothetical protein [Candidatus Moranbacteria bacterium]
MKKITIKQKFPKELRDDWKWIVKSMNKCGPQYGMEGEIKVNSIDNTMAKIKNSTGVKIAHEIYELKCRVENYIESQNV